MKPRPPANPISIGLVVVGVAVYALIAAVTAYEGRPFGWAEFRALWPVHLVVALMVLNLVTRSNR